MEKIRIGDEVFVNLPVAVDDAPWLKENLSPTLATYKGTVRRIASNGKIGVEFNIPMLKKVDESYILHPEYVGPSNLHGKGRLGYSLYVSPEAVKKQTRSEAYVQLMVKKEVHEVVAWLADNAVVACM